MNPYLPQNLPFFGTAVRQHNRAAPDSAYVHPLVASYNSGTDEYTIYVPHFQIKRAAGGSTVSVFQLFSLKNEIGLIWELPLTNFSIHPLDLDGEAEVISHAASSYTFVPDGTVFNDTLFLVVGDSLTAYHSETFKFLQWTVQTTQGFFPDQCYVRVRWKNPGCIISGSIWNSTEGFEMLLYSTPAKPEYIYSEEGDTDAKGSFRPDFRRLQKEHEIELIASESVADALAATALFSDVSIEFPYQGFGYENVTDIKILMEWQPDGILAKIKYKFREGFLVRTGCC